MTSASNADPDMLLRQGWDALRRREDRTGQALFERALMIRDRDPNAWYGLALARLMEGNIDGQMAAADHLLGLAPSHLPGLMMKADHFAEVGDVRSAQAFYNAVQQRAPPPEQRTPEVTAQVGRAAARSAHLLQLFERHLNEAVIAAGFDPSHSSRRFAQALDLMFGKKTIYLQAPSAFYFPELPQRQFYEREEFAWIGTLESRTEAIRSELLRVLDDEDVFTPYMKSDPRRPPGEFGGLRENRDWSAFYLIEGGTPSAAAEARCPETLKALDDVPLCKADGRTPSVLFSLLRPGTRIPPHNGQINARLICHLPLIVPTNCALRVGNEVRAWRVGETLIFDDTIEHEAWNKSPTLRVVLLFEIWRPELTPEERALVAALLSAVGSV